jgi:hypothetical protein
VWVIGERIRPSKAAMMRIFLASAGMVIYNLRRKVGNKMFGTLKFGGEDGIYVETICLRSRYDQRVTLPADRAGASGHVFSLEEVENI